MSFDGKTKAKKHKDYYITMLRRAKRGATGKVQDHRALWLAPNNEKAD
jgi:hypothetical protein